MRPKLLNQCPLAGEVLVFQLGISRPGQQSGAALLFGGQAQDRHRAVDQAQSPLDDVLFKARFWRHWAATPLNERQVKLINRLLDGFEGKLTSSKWAAIAKCSPDSALRDITQLLEQGMLRKAPGGGRSTSYELSD